MALIETEALSHVKNKVLKVMKKHIGLKNSLSRRELFIKVYGVTPDSLDFENAHYHSSRLTNCFRSLERDYYFSLCAVGSGASSEIYIPKDKQDLKSYSEYIESKRESLKQRVKAVERFVKAKHYKKFGELKQLQ